MQYCDYAACVTPEGAAAQVEMLRERGILTDEQAEAVKAEKMTAFFRSQIGQRVLSADKVWRELKFSLLVDAKEYFASAGEEKHKTHNDGEYGRIDYCLFKRDIFLVVPLF